MRQKAFGKLYAEFRIEYAASRQHIRLQLFPGVDLQLSLDLCLVLLYGGCRHLHVGGNFIGRPAPHHQHCHRKLCRSQVVRHLVAGVRIVDRGRSIFSVPGVTFTASLVLLTKPHQYRRRLSAGGLALGLALIHI